MNVTLLEAVQDATSWVQDVARNGKAAQPGALSVWRPWRPTEHDDAVRALVPVRERQGQLEPDESTALGNLAVAVQDCHPPDAENAERLALLAGFVHGLLAADAWVRSERDLEQRSRALTELEHHFQQAAAGFQAA